MTAPTQAPGLSAAVARHVASANYASLPATTVAAAKRAILDGVGVMLGASGLSPEARPFVNLARSQPGPAVLLGDGGHASPAAAALANGALAHALDYEDAFDAAPVHPNAALIPAVLAVAAAQGRVSGQQLITAVAVGCDLACRLALSLRQRMEDGGWYPPPIIGAFGAAAAAGKLMNLNERQICDAFSLMLCQTACPGEIKYDRENVLRAVREAFPAQAAVVATQLAAAGVRGFDAPLEGQGGFYRLFVDGHYDARDVLDGLGSHYWIDRLSFKAWPSCRGTHAYIEAVLDLQQQHGFDWRQVVSIEAVGGDIHRMLFEPEARKQNPATAIDAKFSIPFTIAAALVRGRVDLDSFSPAALADPDTLDLAGRIRFTHRADWGMDKAASGEASVVLEDGSTLSAKIESASGAPDRPLSDAALRAKFLMCAGRARRRIGTAAAERFANAIADLDHVKDITALFEALHGAGAEDEG